MIPGGGGALAKFLGNLKLMSEQVSGRWGGRVLALPWEWPPGLWVVLVLYSSQKSLTISTSLYWGGLGGKKTVLKMFSPFGSIPEDEKVMEGFR